MSIWTWNQFLLASSSSRTPRNARWPAHSARQGHCDGHSAALRGTIIILLPTLVVFLLFQRHIVAALLQGSVKG